MNLICIDALNKLERKKQRNINSISVTEDSQCCLLAPSWYLASPKNAILKQKMPLRQGYQQKIPMFLTALSKGFVHAARSDEDLHLIRERGDAPLDVR